MEAIAKHGDRANTNLIMTKINMIFSDDYMLAMMPSGFNALSI